MKDREALERVHDNLKQRIMEVEAARSHSDKNHTVLKVEVIQLHQELETQEGIRQAADFDAEKCQRLLVEIEQKLGLLAADLENVKVGFLRDLAVAEGARIKLAKDWRLWRERACGAVFAFISSPNFQKVKEVISFSFYDVAIKKGFLVAKELLMKDRMACLDDRALFAQKCLDAEMGLSMSPALLRKLRFLLNFWRSTN